MILESIFFGSAGAYFGACVINKGEDGFVKRVLEPDFDKNVAFALIGGYLCGLVASVGSAICGVYGMFSRK